MIAEPGPPVKGSGIHQPNIKSIRVGVRLLSLVGRGSFPTSRRERLQRLGDVEGATAGHLHFVIVLLRPAITRSCNGRSKRTPRGGRPQVLLPIIGYNLVQRL